MGLAASSARLLMYTERKADCELRISQNSTEKMALAREQSQLTQQYNSMLNSKKLAYWSSKDSSYHKLTYDYLMGKKNSHGYMNNDNFIKKQNYNMILTDSKGLVVLSNEYSEIFSRRGIQEGKSFPVNGDNFIKILYDLVLSSDPDFQITEAEIKSFLDNTDWILNGPATAQTSLGNTEETSITHDKTKLIKNKIAYYYPIVLAAATNGWTSEYANQLEPANAAMYGGEDYLGDALQSGIFNLVLVDEEGRYKPDTSLAYFTTADGCIRERSDSADKEKLTAWYNAEHDRITEKETYLDLDITNLSTELEAIKTAIKSIESFTQDAITSIFSWGSG